MAKILKNQKSPAADIEVNETGVTIPASGQITIDPINYSYWATPETITELTSDINSGDIVVNDGTQDLSASEGIRFLKYPDSATVKLNGSSIVKVITSINVQGDATVTDSGNGEAALIIGETGTPVGKLYTVTGFGIGVTENKWLNVEHPVSTSDKVPFVMPGDGSAIAMTYSNENNFSISDIEFYVNGALEYTWNIVFKRTAYKVLNSGLFTVDQGDRVSMYVKSVPTPSAVGFEDSDVNVSTDTVNKTTHGLITGDKVTLNNTPTGGPPVGDLPEPLEEETDYFIIRIDDDNIKFATTLPNAIAGTPIDITSASGGGDHEIVPQASTKPKDPSINLSLMLTGMSDGDGGTDSGV